MIGQSLDCVILCFIRQAGAAWAVSGLGEKALKASLLEGKRACVEHARAQVLGQVGLQMIDMMTIAHPFVHFVFVGAGWLRGVAVGGARFNPWCCCGWLRVFSVPGGAAVFFGGIFVVLFVVRVCMDAMLAACSQHLLQVEHVCALLTQVT